MQRKPTLRSRAVGLALTAWVPWLLFVSPAQAAPGAHGPGGEHLDAPGAAATPSGLGRLPDGSVNVPKSAQRRLAIRTMLAPQTEAAVTVELPGRVLMDPNASGRVQAAHGGRVEPGPRGLPVAGQSVRRGDVLAYVRHHAEPYAVGTQQSQLAELRGQRQVAERRVERLQGLEGTVPRKEIDAARTEAASLAERERSIRTSLAAREALVAPISGVISRAEIVAGQIVEPRAVLLEVIDPGRVLVEATTADAALPGRVGAASLQGIDDAKLRLLGAARVLRDGVLPVTFVVASAKPGGVLPLAIGQPVTVLVQSTERAKGVVVPAGAVVRNAVNETVVWIKSGAERFIAQPVQATPLDAGNVLVTQGLAPDNRVVVQGASLIAQIR